MTDHLVSELRDRLAAGRVLVVAGSGISVAATGGDRLASWRGLIESGVGRCVALGKGGADERWGEVQRELLARDGLDDLLGVAEQVSRRLGYASTGPCGGDWSGWLRETVGSLRPSRPALIEALRDLGAPLATLNYDGLIADVTRRPPVTWQEAPAWLPVLEGGDEAVLHLHGHWRRPGSVVLGIRSYDAVLRDGLAQHLQRVVATTRSLLFVGCAGTLEDPNLEALLTWMRDHLGGAEHRHYLLVREGDGLPVPRRTLDAARIHPVPYGTVHADLEPFLRRLAPAPASAPTALGPTGSNLPLANPDFVDRADILGRLERELSPDAGPTAPAVAVTGLKGVGKSQVALAHARRGLAAGRYRLVWWLRAGDPATLAADYAALAAPFGLEAAASDQAAVSRAVGDALRGLDRWLLVFDDASPEAVRPYLPDVGGGRALITSWRADWRGTARELRLDAMEEGEALRLLAGRPDPDALPPADLAEAKALARDLGHLPLALAQARAYMDATGRDFAGYRALLARSRPRVLDAGRAGPDYPATVARTWQVAVEAAVAACAAAGPLLELLAFFAPNALPLGVLAADPSALPPALRDEIDRDAAVAALSRFCLVRTTRGAVSVHTLVQAVTRDGQTEELARERSAQAVALVDASLPRPPQEHTGWPEYQLLLPHASAAARAAEELGVGAEAAVRVLNALGIYHEARAALGEAERLYMGALDLGSRALGPDHAMLAGPLTNLAGVYQETGRYAEAEPIYLRAADIHEGAFGSHNPQFVILLNNIGEYYREEGRFDEAEPFYRRALGIAREALGERHRTVGDLSHNLALLLDAVGQPAEAEALHRQALEIGRETLGPEHPQLALRMAKVAGIHQRAGSLEEAGRLLVAAVEIAERSVGPEHPTTASVLHDLALFHSSVGDRSRAEPLFRRCIALTEVSLGNAHPALLARVNGLAVLLWTEGGREEAEALWLRAVTIAEMRLHPEHPDLAIAFNNLALAYLTTGRASAAAPLLGRALAIEERVFGPDSPAIAVTLNNIGECHQALDHLADAEPAYRRAIALLEPDPAASPGLLRSALTNYARLLDRLDRAEEAAVLRRRAEDLGDG